MQRNVPSQQPPAFAANDGPISEVNFLWTFARAWHAVTLFEGCAVQTIHKGVSGCLAKEFQDGDARTGQGLQTYDVPLSLSIRVHTAVDDRIIVVS